MARDNTRHSLFEDAVSKSLEKSNKSRGNTDADLKTIPSEAGLFPEEEFVSVTDTGTGTPVLLNPDNNIPSYIEKNQVQKDGLWAWIACVCAILNQLLIFGTLNVYSLFLVKFITEFDITTSNAAWLGSLTMGLMKLFGPVASSMSMHMGNKRTMVLGAAICATSLVCSSLATSFNLLFATFGVPFALGSALAITPAVVVPLDYFAKHQAMAMGLVAAGSSLGTLLLAPWMQILLEWVNWRRTFQIHSVFVAILILVNMLVRPRKVKPLSYIQKPMLRSLIMDLSLWKSRVFLLWVLAIAIVYFGYQVPNILLASYAVFLGSTPRDASYIIMTMGGATTISRLATGRFLRCNLLSRLHFKQIIFVVMGTMYLLLAHVTTLQGLYIFAVARGLLDGAHIVMLPMLTASMVGASKAILGWGYLAGAISITYTLGPPTAGALRDWTGRYQYSFIMAGLPLIFSGLLLFLLPWAQRTGRATNVLQALSYVESNGEETEEQRSTYKEMVSPLGSIQDFIRQEALFSALSTSQITSRTSTRSKAKSQPKRVRKALSDSYFQMKSPRQADYYEAVSRSDAVVGWSDSLGGQDQVKSSKASGSRSATNMKGQLTVSWKKTQKPLKTSRASI